MKDRRSARCREFPDNAERGARPCRKRAHGRGCSGRHLDCRYRASVCLWKCANGRRIRSRPLRKSASRSEEHTSELQSQSNLVCRLLLEKKKITTSSAKI